MEHKLLALEVFQCFRVQLLARVLKGISRRCDG